MSDNTAITDGFSASNKRSNQMPYIVTVKTKAGEKVPLRGTVWAFSMDRAQRFETPEAAKAALEKAKKFMKASVYKQAQIEQVD